MEIVVRQISGLGNQLFQYAAGRYYARQYGASMRMVLDPAKKAFAYGSPRPFLLSHFWTTAPVSELTALDQLFLLRRKSVRAFQNVAKRLLDVDVFQEGFERRYEFLPELPVRLDAKTLYLAGYFQTYRIADALGDELRAEFAFREPPAGKNLDVMREIAACANPVSLHVRRGDFTLQAEGNIALPVDYYARAIARMREQVADAKFFVFSDDMDFTRANLPTGLDAVFVTHNDNLTAHEDLRLMSACRHHIIANSTFSWWGAWLNASTEKMVIAPRYWLRTPDSYFVDLMPVEWELLEV